MDKVRQFKDTSKSAVSIILVGNKTDLGAERSVVDRTWCVQIAKAPNSRWCAGRSRRRLLRRRRMTWG
jgi:hypothetical protein